MNYIGLRKLHTVCIQERLHDKDAGRMCSRLLKDRAALYTPSEFSTSVQTSHRL